jgi:RimJ/RimL family protein N-acetyltransferase
MSPFEIRLLQAEDAPAYRDLMLHAYQTHPEAFTSSAAERAVEPMSWWSSRIGGPASAQRVFGAFVDGALQGVAGLRFETGEKVRHKATLFGMAVRPEHRGRGLARALVQAVLASAQDEPMALLVQLTVSEGNAAAEGLYAACGFVRFGVEPFAMRHGAGFVAKVHMWRPVKPLGASQT